MSTQITRRDFVKLGARGLALASLGVPGLMALAKAAPRQRPPTARPKEEGAAVAWAFVVDINRCIGCGRCVLACKLENRVPLEAECNRTWVERYVLTAAGKVHSDSPDAGIHGFSPALDAKFEGQEVVEGFFVPKLCNQCENPPCVSVCPVNASYKTPEGVILVDQRRCIGCRYCIIACPYGARYFLPDAPTTPTGQSRVVDKCTWCYHRITQGLEPACVEACPVGARLFGDLRDDESRVAHLLREQETHTPKPALGTKPRVYYLGLRDWMD